MVGVLVVTGGMISTALLGAWAGWVLGISRKVVDESAAYREGYEAGQADAAWQRAGREPPALPDPAAGELLELEPPDEAEAFLAELHDDTGDLVYGVVVPPEPGPADAERLANTWERQPFTIEDVVSWGERMRDELAEWKNEVLA